MKLENLFCLILIFAISAGFLLRFYGSNWGIPQEPYWRNHYQDEAFVLGLIFKMDPPDLNPHYFINPTLHYYTLLFSLKIASLLGYIKHFSLPITTNHLGQPIEKVSLDDYAKMYRIGRILSVIEGTLLIFFVFLIARNLYNKKIGVIAALLTAILPSLIYQSHFLVVDIPGVFWLILAFFFLTNKILPAKINRWFILSGLFIGLAIGTKYTNILLFVPFLYKVYKLNKNKNLPFLKMVLNRYTFITLIISILTFLLTTPYSLLSWNEFLNGDANGFGGIFGKRGLLYYNAYPTNLLLPFSVTTYHSLRLPLTVFAILSLIYLAYKRKYGDLLLLSFIIPFYLMLIYRASPHLRHILPVLPFLTIAIARMFVDLISNRKLRLFKLRFFKLFIIGIAIFTFIYTFLFSLAMLTRFTSVDTRIESVNWVRENISPEATFGLATFFPWNYTPPLDMITDKIVLTGYNYENLLKLSPDYFILTEYEEKEFPYARETSAECERFIRYLFRGAEYKIIREFSKDFEILGIKIFPRFPNMDWNPINPRIYIFKRIGEKINIGE